MSAPASVPHAPAATALNTNSHDPLFTDNMAEILPCLLCRCIKSSLQASRVNALKMSLNKAFDLLLCDYRSKPLSCLCSWLLFLSSLIHQSNSYNHLFSTFTSFYVLTLTRYVRPYHSYTVIHHQVNNHYPRGGWDSFLNISQGFFLILAQGASALYLACLLDI